MTVHLNLTENEDGERVSISLEGDLDIAGVPGLEARLMDLRGRHGHVVLDLARLEFIDSTGLSLLVRTSAEATQEGWRLSIIPGPPGVQSLFERTGTLAILPFETGR